MFICISKLLEVIPSDGYPARNFPDGSTICRACMRDNACGDIPINELTDSKPRTPAKAPVPPCIGPNPANLTPGCPGAAGNFKSNDCPSTTPHEIVPTRVPLLSVNV